MTWSHSGHSGAETNRDVICCHVEFGGQTWAIEVKEPKKELRPLQEYKQQKVRNAGGVAFRAESVQDVIDMEERCRESQT